MAWYYDLDIYQVHVRAFYDSSGDGIGDLRGLREKIGYIRSLGVGAVWLLPIFPSPLRDAGYDVSDFRDVHPDLGTLEEFQEFLDAAHKAELRVLLDLVLNHTSDRHPWFQSARRGPGHPYHDYYVWSPIPDRYAGARILFPDTETSNWTFEPGCNLYYWHRFYSHQPDLNYDHPEVRREMLDVVKFWLDLGVDGFRCDAVPYLFEREGTSCENLPETHAFLKELRQRVDRYEPPRVLLAEANQRPKELLTYLGHGDECHLAFHFPLMPRMFQAVHMESAQPLIDVLRETPALPPGCQWAIFLRNHDELTLEMVSPEEREYMLQAFASGEEMRFNLGIRRRLWPLMMGGRRQIELLHGLVLGLPGCAVFYYGDEIGMGDNLLLGERLSVRTPMQWTPGPNAGFSHCEPSRLEVPVVETPEFHYAGQNVQSLDRKPTSFLNWFRRMIGAHREVPAFHGGSLRFVESDNPRVFAFVREKERETVLCVYNLSRFVQGTRLDLSEWRHRVPVEVLGGTVLPAIGETAYPLTLGPHTFYWMRIELGSSIPSRTILFVCQYNSARSQMAEALARTMAPPGVRILSAGLTATVVNDEVVRALEEMRVGTAGLRSKTIEELAGEDPDDVVVLAEEAWIASARRFPEAAFHYWAMADPIAEADPSRVPSAVRNAMGELARRLRNWFSREERCL